MYLCVWYMPISDVENLQSIYKANHKCSNCIAMGHHNAKKLDIF